MRQINRRIWAGIGAATLVSAVSGLPTVGDQPKKSAKSEPTTASGPGRGGETYLSDGGPSDTRVRYIRDLTLFVGQVMIAQELVTADQWDDALSHLIEQTADVRDAMQPYLQRHGLAPFAADLAALADAIEARDADAFRRARVILDVNLNAASALVKRFSTPHYRFALRALIETAKAASSAYEAALDGDAVQNVAEYREGRGYMAAARLQLAEIQSELANVDDTKARMIAAEFEALANAWPTLKPPKSVAHTTTDVAEHVARLVALAASY